MLKFNHKVLNTKIQFGTKYYSEINNHYKENIELIKKLNIKVHGRIVVPIDDIDSENRSHQIRDNDIDKAHLGELKRDIETNSLETIPSVEFDNMSQKFEPAGGHHRIESMRELGCKNIPVLVLDFENKDQKMQYLYLDNDHRPALRLGKSEIKKYARYALDAGSVKLDPTDSAEQAGQKLKSYVQSKVPTGRLHDKTWTEIISDVDPSRKYKWKKYTKSDIVTETKNIFGGTYKSGFISYENSEAKVSGGANAAIKTVMNTVINYLSDNKRLTDATLDIDMIVHIDSEKSMPYSSLVKQRQDFIDKCIVLNSQLLYNQSGKKNCQISKITFLKQILDGVNQEKDHVYYKYNEDENTFNRFSRR